MKACHHPTRAFCASEGCLKKYDDSDDTTALGNGGDGVYDRVEYKYNRQGQRIELKDQTATVHEYVLDALGRVTADKITTLGTGVDGTVRRIQRAYEVRGMVDQITSYDAATAGNKLNEVVREYNDFGQLSKDYQEHEGAKDANTLDVQYAYTNGSSNHTRLTGITYPNARVLHHEYSSGDDNNLSRLTYLSETNSAGTHYAEYTYLGLGRVLKTDYTEPDLRQDVTHRDGSGLYDYIDRFGRVVDHLWYDYGASADAARIKHGYDQASNRTVSFRQACMNLFEACGIVGCQHRTLWRMADEYQEDTGPSWAAEGSSAAIRAVAADA